MESDQCLLKYLSNSLTFQLSFDSPCQFARLPPHHAGQRAMRCAVSLYLPCCVLALNVNGGLCREQKKLTNILRQQCVKFILV